MSGPKPVIFSGVCVCGHDQMRHHGNMVVRPEYAAVLGHRLPGACEAYGSNENEALDPYGDYHCGGFVDEANPDPNELVLWSGTTADEVRQKGYDRYWELNSNMLDATILAEDHWKAETADEKQWVIDQMVRAMLGTPENYAEWREDMTRIGREWSEGIKPSSLPSNG